jgi:ubiquinone/menaquinone biosynthesis C-methylase UbiE
MNIIVSKYQQYILENEHLTPDAKSFYIELIKELSSFPLGMYLLENKVLNGYWTDYILTITKDKLTSASSLEKKMLTEFPILLATQERYKFFLRENQKYVRDGASLASIPSGVGGELFNLDYSKASNVELHLVDISDESLDTARSRFTQQQVAGFNSCNLHTQQEDAWLLSCHDKFDLISSNGLSIYEKSDQRIRDLYQVFFKALNSKGVLVTSTITPPEVWDYSKIDQNALSLQQIVFKEIIGVKWQALRSVALTEYLLYQVGFKHIEVFYDQAKMFPTVVAHKG